MKTTNDRSLTKLADAAFVQAARKVLERAEQSGTPVIIWEDDEVKQVGPQNIPKPQPVGTHESR